MTPLRTRLLPAAIVTAWGAAIWMIAARGGLQPSEAGPPARLAIAFFGPVALFALAYWRLPALRAWVARQDMALLVGAQTWRVLGMVFLFLLGLNLLPATFAVPAGVGDVAVGVYALFVLMAVMREGPGWPRQVRALVVLGVADFLLAIGTASLSGLGGPLQVPGAPLPFLMQSLPMVLIPAFLVPLFMILHLMTWLKLPRP